MKTFILAVLIFTCNGLFGNSIKQSKEVLLLQSYHQGYKWSDDIRDAIVAKFSLHENIELNTLYMDTKRIDSQEYLNSLASLYKKQFKTRTFDLVMAADNAALDFVLKYHQEIFNGAPIVFLGINDFNTHFEIPPFSKNLITGVVEEVDIKSTIELIKQMHPNLRHLMVINDRSKTGLAVKSEFDAILPLVANDLDIDYVDDLDIVSLKKRVSALGSDSAILFLSLIHISEPTRPY